MAINIKDQNKLVVQDNNIVDEATGLYLPSSIVKGRASGMSKDMPEALKRMLNEKGVYDLGLIQGFYQGGYSINRDTSTLIMHIPTKGSDSSELLMSAMASGEVNNVGASPVVSSQLIGLIRRQQVQAGNIELNLTGRVTPTNKARNAIMRFNDSPLGVTQSVSDMVYNLRVYCRGCPIATVPIGYDISVWPENGLGLIPIEIDGEESDKIFYLNVDWDRVKTPVPYIYDPLRFRQSGLPTWPYWFLADDGGAERWVLLHQSHVIPVVPGNSLRYDSLLGTSSVWIMLEHLSEQVLVIEERIERKISSATNGLLGISGITQTGKQVADEIDLQTEIRRMENKYFSSDYTILTGKDRIAFTFLPLRQGDGIPLQERREYFEDALSLAFNEPLTAIVSRGGIGFATNAAEQSNTTSDTGVTAILSALEIVLGTIYPRVQVSVSRQNDPAQRLNVATLKDFSSAIQDLNASTPEGVLTTEEIRALIDRDLFEIPEIDQETVQAGATADDDAGDVKKPESEDDDDSDRETEQDTEVEAAVREVEQHIFNVRYELEPVEPVGADDPIPEATPDPQAITSDAWNSDMPDYEGMLEAEPSEDEEFPERSQEQPEAESWLWLMPIFTFYNIYNGRFVDEPRALELRDELSLIREIQAVGLAPPLAVGDITIQEWVADMRGNAQRSYVHQYMLGRGGQNMLTDADWDWLFENVNLAYSEIDYLAERMAMGAYSEAQIANYSQTLIGSAIQGYEAGRASAYGLDLPDYPGSFRLDCRGRCRCHWDNRPIFNGPTLIGYDSYWELNPRARHCTSCLENNSMYYPFVTRF
jgi:hypothetical protein